MFWKTRELKEENEKLREELRKAENRIYSLQREIGELEKELREKEGELKEAREEIEVLRSELERLNRIAEKRSEELYDVRSENWKLKEDYSSLREWVENHLRIKIPLVRIKGLDIGSLRRTRSGNWAVDVDVGSKIRAMLFSEILKERFFVFVKDRSITLQTGSLDKFENLVDLLEKVKDKVDKMLSLNSD